MRIVFVTFRHWPSVGGVEIYIHRLAGALRALGHRVSIVTGAHVEGLPGTEIHEGVPIYRFPAHRSPLRAWWHLMRMRSLFVEADVIHISDVVMLEYFHRMVAWTLPRKPLFLTRHGMSYNRPVPAVEKARARRSLKLADGIIHDGKFIETWLGVAPDSVPDQGLFPEADDLPDIPEPAPNSATFVGRLEPDTGIDLYVDAIALLKEQYGLEVKLDVYGDGTLADQLHERVERQDLPVTFHGWRVDAQERVTDGCFAFIAGRMAMQEAMARRRLVVAAYVDPMKRDYVNGEPFSPYLVSGGDAETIASLVAHYIRQPDERHRLVKLAYAHARTLSWTRTARAYLNLWERAPRREERQSSWFERLVTASRIRTRRDLEPPPLAS